MHPCCRWISGHPFHILLNVIFEKFVGPLPLAFSTMESTGLK